MATMADDGDAASAAPMPTKVEDVDKFMAELAAAAGVAVSKVTRTNIVILRIYRREL